jgi:uncharacterized linocin/CFP29 family protein
MNHLLRELAPISESVWQMLDEEARERLKPALAACKLVDFSGPRGWEHSATNLGRTDRAESAPSEGVSGLRRRVLPLLEMRADFELSRAELRDAERGADDADLDALDQAAHDIAVAENVAVAHGWQGVITGISEATPNEPMPLGQAPVEYPRPVAAGRTPVAERRRGSVWAGTGKRAIPFGDRDGRAGRLPAARTPTQDRRGTDRVGAGRDRGAPAEPARRRFHIRLRPGHLDRLRVPRRRSVRLYLEESFSFHVATSEAAVGLTP